MTKRPTVIVEKRRQTYIAPPKPAPAASPWHTFDVRPKYGKRIIALDRWGEYSEPFFVDHNGFLNHAGVRVPFIADDLIRAFSFWAYMPASYRLHFEQRQEIPATRREIRPTRRWPEWPEAVAKASKELAGEK